uniref:Protein Jade-1 n=1 Tax=Paramormyrops kingsleyae TaxID=1676925 RepID=A0A3B3SY31_9TELE
MKRNKHPSSSDESDDGSKGRIRLSSPGDVRWVNSTTVLQVFRTDLITAMKLHDSVQLNPEDFFILLDSWRQEWEKGVQVPVSPNSIPRPLVRATFDKTKAIMFSRPKKLIRSSGSEPPPLGYVGLHALAEATCRYDLCELDMAWLEIANEEFREMGLQNIDELTMERVMEEFEQRCYDNMSHAMETEEGLGIEYDEDVVCDVCQSPDGEDGNEMVFCDKCNICVHQACYGILKVPEGSWLCRTCALGVAPKCQLCPQKGGAMKPTRSGSKWVHVSCALWIPEVSIGNPEMMEPITNVSHIPSNRWALLCCLCQDKTGACIQCSAKNCRTAFHVTCALHCGLEMNTILTETDEVKFRSFCLKHSSKLRARREDGRGVIVAPLQAGGQYEPTGSGRKMKLQQLEDEFFRFVVPGDVARGLHLSEELVDFLYQYWKLRRRANFNRPLLTPKRDEEDNLAKKEQDVLLCRLRLFTHLRQDLERVRNLTYMVTRREKIKRSLCRVQEQIFQHRIRLLEEPRRGGILLNACVLGLLVAREGSSRSSEDATFLSWVSSHPVKLRPGRRAEPAPQSQDRGGGGLRGSARRPPDHERELSGTRSHRRVTRGPEAQLASDRRSGLRERAPPKAAPPRPGHTSSKYNGLLRANPCPASQRPATAVLKNWGTFKIPKKSGRQVQVDRDVPPRGLAERNTPGRTRSRPCARAQLANSNVGTKGKCHVPITRRYGSDIMPRGILAS